MTTQELIAQLRSLKAQVTTDAQVQTRHGEPTRLWEVNDLLAEALTLAQQEQAERGTGLGFRKRSGPVEYAE